jgi:hypothetical protein
LRNVTGAITVNPGDPQRFVEVLYWKPHVVPEMGVSEVDPISWTG